ncbi:unnamed protein product [Prorocentrum cordatum]|uniref:Uncharacterized protein n=1 Tax=Prorocentrum cordatum TaxID=2364126 RepID=A0ABN9RK61_9DINO|nr:unnamed protein product [Polarella glacialis]
MDEEESDPDIGDEHIRILCSEVVSERLVTLQRSMDDAVGKSVKSAVETEAGSIASAFQRDFDSCFEKCQKDLQAFPGKLDQQIRNSVAPKLDELPREVTARCDDLKRDVLLVDQKVETHAKLLAEMQEQTTKLQSALVEANSARPAPKNLAGIIQFDRDTDPTIIKLNAGKLVSRQAVIEIIPPWLAEHNIEESNWNIDSPDHLSKMFTMRLTGAAGLASRRVQKLLSSLRLSSSSRREFEVAAQYGGAARLHVSGDKNPKQIKLELTGRKMRNKLQDIYGREQKISLTEIVIEVLPGREATRIMWNPGTIAKFGVSKETVVEAAQEIIQPDSGPAWCL